MKTINSLSGGQTSSYIAANYPADYNIFALVTVKDKGCLYPDKKVRQLVSDKIGREFIGTVEDDIIITTMLDLEQYLGKEIIWVAGMTFEELIDYKNNFLPNIMTRYCTTWLKLKPMFDWWQKNINEPINMNIGFRANEQSRAKSMMSNLNKNGLTEFHTITGKSKNGKRNTWGLIEWQAPKFPLIKDNIYKDNIVEFWRGKPVQFAWLNNCVGCFHRNPILLKLMSDKHPNKFDWFINQEQHYGGQFKKEVSYLQIKKHKTQLELFKDDFNECDSGFCGF